MKIHNRSKVLNGNRMRALFKDTLREIRKSMGRFISIMAIVAIGVAFFAGVSGAPPDMRYSADIYFDQYNFMDFKILSTLGLNQEDIDKISEIEGVKGIYPTHTMDTLTYADGNELVLKTFGLKMEENRDKSNHYINQYRLEEGRFPTSENECLIEKGKILGLGFQIGDEIELSLGKEEDITDDLSVTKYKIVGLVSTPYYLSYEKGSSSIGNGKVSSYIVIPEQNFKQEIYSEVLVTIEGVKDFNTYDDAYFEVTDQFKEDFEDLGLIQSEIRYADVKKEAMDKLNEGIIELEDAKATFNTEITKAKKDIVDAKKAISDGEKTLKNEIESLNITMAEGEKQLQAASKQLDEAQIQYDEGLAQFLVMKPQVEDLINKAQTALIEQINNQAYIQSLINQNQGLLMQYKAELAILQDDPDYDQNSQVVLDLLKKITDVESSIDKNKETLNQINQGIKQLEGQISLAQGQLDAGQKKLDDSLALITSGRAEIATRTAQLKEGTATAQIEFQKAEDELAKGRKELAEGEATLTKNEIEGQDKIDQAQDDIISGQKEIDELENAEWFVLDRKSHYSYMDYGSAADRMEAIASVFPPFFFLVAALVCLTTMTRMVDEQRQTIGTFKALGYSKIAIAFKYVFYAAIASLVGSGIGLLIGMYLFPLVIFNAWGIMYTLPTLYYEFQPGIMTMATLAAVLITTLASVAACYKELVETPALLMRPKAPKNGKKILLENIRVIWSRLSFSEKVTARNIFRYKKRFFMTVIGISGCTALLLAGFGIQDSIGELVDKQFKELTLYDCIVTLDSKITKTELTEFNDLLSGNQYVEDSLSVYQVSVDISNQQNEESIVLIVPSDEERFKSFTDLRTRVKHKPVILEDEGIVLTEKLAKNLSVSIGDRVKLDGGNDYSETVKVIGIVENYISHYVFMSSAAYTSSFGIKPPLNTSYLKLSQAGIEQQSEFGIQLMNSDHVVSTSFYTSIIENFSGMISSLGIVVIVLVISAGLLAFVVLYNLTNVNISERLREIATIKVLGFYDKEVSSYVFRENIVLGFIGSLCGLALGVILHQFIIVVAELDTVMFGRNIKLISYFYALAITMLFTQIVNMVMHNKLKRIKMVESLKSVE